MTWRAPLHSAVRWPTWRAPVHYVVDDVASTEDDVAQTILP
jgi:hypothetical protein